MYLSDSSDDEIDWVGQISVDEDDCELNEGKQGHTFPEFEPNQEKVEVGDSGAEPFVQKTKWNVKFNNERSKNYPWIVRGKDIFQAKCTICDSQFTAINHGGENDIIKHMKTEKHEKSTTKGSQGKKIDAFLLKKRFRHGFDRTSRISFLSNSIKHAHSYLSADCACKLSSRFPNFKIWQP